MVSRRGITGITQPHLACKLHKMSNECPFLSTSLPLQYCTALLFLPTFIKKLNLIEENLNFKKFIIKIYRIKMPNPLSHIYKMHQIYENNWTQLYNKTILYKKVQDCVQINTNKSKKTLQNFSFIEDLFLLNLQIYKTVSNCLMLATISRETRTGSESISTRHR